MLGQFMALVGVFLWSAMAAVVMFTLVVVWELRR